MKQLNEQGNARRSFQLRRRREGDGAGGTRSDEGRRRIEVGVAARSRRAAGSLVRVGCAVAMLRENESRLRAPTRPVAQGESIDSIAKFGAMVAAARIRASRSSSCCGGSDMPRARSSEAPRRTKNVTAESPTCPALSQRRCDGAGCDHEARCAIRALRRNGFPREALRPALRVWGTSGEVREMNGTS